jgi:hypothetical protein
MYKIMRKVCGGIKRYNTKSFATYQEAKKYLRRLGTKLYGHYSDTYSQYGFTIQKV